MKKIISLLTCLAIFSGTMIISSASEADIAASEDNAAKFMLEYIEVAGYSEGEGGNANNFISRADFSEMVSKALKLNYLQNDIYFNDVRRDHWAYNYINALVDAGIVSKASDGMFRPEDEITFAEACKMVTCLLGYSLYADSRGGFPLGYIDTAKKLDIIEGISDTDKLTTKSAVILLYNTMKTGIYDVNRIEYGSNGTVGLEYYQSDKTPFSIYWDLYVAEGRVNGYYGASMDGSDVEKNTLIIDGNKYTVEDTINPKPYFASIVEFVYEKPHKDYPGELLYIEKSKSKNECLEISSEQLIGFNPSDYSIRYYRKLDASSSTSVNISRKAKVYYNGDLYTDKLDGIFKELGDGKHRGIISINNSDEGENDIVVIESARAFVIAYSDNKGKVINKYNSSDVIDINLAEYVNFYDTQGNIIENSVNEGEVFMVTTSQDGDNLTFSQIKPEIVGIVESVQTANNIVKVDGKNYYVDKAYLTKMGLPEIGGTYKLYVDKFGYIVAESYETAASAMTIGYIVAGEPHEEAFSQTLRLKLFTEANEMKIFELADKTRIDGISYKVNNLTKDDYASVFPGASVSAGKLKIPQQIIRFTLNKDGKINKIDTSNYNAVEGEQRSTLSRYPDDPYYGLKNEDTSSNGHRKYMVTAGSGDTYYRFGTDVIFTKNKTKMFVVPLVDSDGYMLMHEESGIPYSADVSEGLTPKLVYPKKNGVAVKELASDDMYSFGYYEKFRDALTYPIQAYDLDPNNPFCDIIVYKKDVAITERNALYIVTGYTKELDSEGEARTKIWLNGGTSVGYLLDDDNIANELEVGDIISPAIDATGEMMYGYFQKYDVGDDKYLNVGNNTPAAWASGSGYNYRAVKQISRGRVLSKENGVLQLDWNNDGTVEERLVVGTLPVLILDKTEDPDRMVEQGTIADIVDAETAGAGLESEVLLVSYVGRYSMIIVLKNLGH